MEGVEKEWQGLREKKTKGRHYFSLHHYKSQLLFWNPEKTVKICRLRFGHCRLNQNLHIIGKHSTALCECGRPETCIKHVFLECSKYNTERETFYKRL